MKKSQKCAENGTSLLGNGLEEEWAPNVPKIAHLSG